MDKLNKLSKTKKKLQCTINKYIYNEKLSTFSYVTQLLLLFFILYLYELFNNSFSYSAHDFIVLA